MTERNQQPAPAPPVPPNATAFTFSAGASFLTLTATVMAAIQAAVFLWGAWSTPDPSTRLIQIPKGIFVGFVAYLNWYFFWRSRSRILVSDEGIWGFYGRVSRFIAWRDAGRVRANDAAQQLEISDTSGNSTIKAEYHLRNFDALRNIVLQHTAEQMQRQATSTTTFHCGWQNKGFFGAIAAAAFYVAWTSFLHGSRIELIVAAALGLFAVFLVLREPVQVRIDRDSIHILYLAYQRVIPFDKVLGITLEERAFRSKVSTGVLIRSSQGAKVWLSGFREGSIELYESLLQGWKKVAISYGVAWDGSHGPLLPRHAPRAWTKLRFGRSAGIAFVIIVSCGAALVHSIRATGLVDLIQEQANNPDAVHGHLHHRGPIAPLQSLRGKGRVYLVQIGPHKAPYSLSEFAEWLHSKYGLDVQVLPAMQTDNATWDGKRKEYVAEQLFAQIKREHESLASDPDAYLIGFTDEDMYSEGTMWSSLFTQRDQLRTAVISSSGLGELTWQEKPAIAAGAQERFRARIRRILLKDVAMLYWHLPVNEDATSLLHDPLDPDLPTEDIYASDLDPALSRRGQELYEPCIYFTYSAKEGTKPWPGPLVRECNSVQNPMEDESVELFEVDLGLGLLIDKHTDFYLPDTIPIEFQRATRDGGRGKNPFGISGRDYYDEFLGSADNIKIFAEQNDGARIYVNRYPNSVPFTGLVKYVGGESEIVPDEGLFSSGSHPVWRYELAWHALPYEHYDLRDINGWTKTYLPCDSPDINCILVGYKNAQGNELKIDREENRHLSRVTSPNGNWVGLGVAQDGRIMNATDNHGRTVSYSYDQRNRLIQVTYPSGAIYSYDYDETQHLLAAGVAPNANAEPDIVLRNEYTNGLLTQQTLPDGSVYSYAYDSADPNAIHHAVVHAPGGVEYHIRVGYDYSTVYENRNVNDTNWSAPSGH